MPLELIMIFYGNRFQDFKQRFIHVFTYSCIWKGVEMSRTGDNLVLMLSSAEVCQHFLMRFEYKSQLFLQSSRIGDLSISFKQTNKCTNTEITFTTRSDFERKGLWSLLLAGGRTGSGGVWSEPPAAGLNTQDRSVARWSRGKMYLF